MRTAAAVCGGAGGGHRVFRCKARASQVTVERLEGRRLLSADLTGSFVGPVPTELRPSVVNHVRVKVMDAGDAAASGNVVVNLFASAGGVEPMTPLAIASRQVRLNPRRGSTFSLRFSSPSTLPNGNYFLVARIDPSPAVGDVGPGNDQFTSPTTVTVLQPFVDLTGQIVTQPPSGYVGAERPQKVRVRVVNDGNDTARGPLAIALYLSKDPILDASDPVVATLPARDVSIRPGSTKLLSLPLALPAGTPLGSYSLIAVVDPAHGLPDANFANNVILSPAPLAVTNPPLVIDTTHHRHGHFHDLEQSIDYGSAGFGVIGGVTVVAAADAQNYPIDDLPPDEPPPPTTVPTSQPDDSAGNDPGGPPPATQPPDDAPPPDTSSSSPDPSPPDSGSSQPTDPQSDPLFTATYRRRSEREYQPC